MKLPKVCKDNIPSRAGFTLIEVLIVVGLIGLIATLGVLIGFDSITRSSLGGERDFLVSFIVGARARALANVDESPQGIYIDENSVILFEGSEYNPADPNNRISERNSSILISPNPTEIVFEQLSANVTSGAGVFTLSSDEKTAEVDVNTVGRVEW